GIRFQRTRAHPLLVRSPLALFRAACQSIGTLQPELDAVGRGGSGMDRDRSRLMGGWEHLYAEWDRVGSRLMSGVCHYFNDRLMVVLGTIDLREGLDGELTEDLRVIRGE